jgi:hypothetical protein
VVTHNHRLNVYGFLNLQATGRRRICQLCCQRGPARPRSCASVGPRTRCYIRGRPRLRNDLRPIWWRRKSPCAYGDAGS